MHTFIYTNVQADILQIQIIIKRTAKNIIKKSKWKTVHYGHDTIGLLHKSKWIEKYSHTQKKVKPEDIETNWIYD